MSDSKSLRDMSPQELDAMVGRITDIVMQELGSRGAETGAAANIDSNPQVVQSGPPPAPAAAPSAAPGPNAIAATERMSLPPGTTANQCAPVSDFIDHTLLKPDATEDEVRAICAEARDNKFASVCVNGAYVDLVAAALKGSGVKTCAVVGFPLGAMTSTAKAYEAADLIKRGADEIDMVINVGKLKSRDYSGALEDIAAVRAATRGATLKVILETSLLDDEEKRAGCVLSKAAGADFVKTSTGFGGGGATAEDIALMRRVVGPKMGVKASGGIRTCDDALAMIASGATRLGASAGVKIVKGEKSGGSGY